MFDYSPTRYNLDPFQQHSDADIWQALDKSHIAQLVSYNCGQLNKQTTTTPSYKGNRLGKITHTKM